MDTFSTIQMAGILGEHWRSVGTWMGKKDQFGNVCLLIENKDYFYRFTWVILKRLERSRIWLPCGRNWWKTLILENQHHSFTCIWDVLSVFANRTKMLLRNLQRCLNHVFLLEQLKNYKGGQSSRKDGGVVLWYGRTCSEMCWAILRAGKQEGEAVFSRFQVLAWMIINPNRKNLNQLENYHKFAHKLCDMFVPGTNWKTWHSMVSEQTCTIDHKMDQSLWQTIISFDLLHSSYV